MSKHNRNGIIFDGYYDLLLLLLFLLSSFSCDLLSLRRCLIHRQNFRLYWSGTHSLFIILVLFYPSQTLEFIFERNCVWDAWNFFFITGEHDAALIDTQQCSPRNCNLPQELYMSLPHQATDISTCTHYHHVCKSETVATLWIFQLADIFGSYIWFYIFHARAASQMFTLEIVNSTRERNLVYCQAYAQKLCPLQFIAGLYSLDTSYFLLVCKLCKILLKRFSSKGYVWFW